MESLFRWPVAWLLLRAAEGGGPSLIEALTYRQGGHSRADPGTYRPQEEVAHWLSRDPIIVYADRYHVGPDRLSELKVAAGSEVEAALQVALAAPEPSPDALLSNVLMGSS